jgi:peptidoglycan/LPS O-acetylase OafA/YrhL
MTTLGDASLAVGASSVAWSARAAKSPLHIPSLDGVRAVAFFIVFLSHAGLTMIPGGFGVTVFFFLSGYLITTLMRVEAERTGTIHLKAFYARRVLRILPPFYLVLAVATLMVWLGFLPGELHLAPVLAQVFHFSNFWVARYGFAGQAPGTVVYWSLAVEEHFYLLFPLLFMVLFRLHLSGRGKALVLWTLCAGVLLWRCILMFVMHADSLRVMYGTDTRLDSILFGCALALHRNPALDPEMRGPEIQRDARLPRNAAWQAGLAVILATMAVPSPLFRETFRYSLQGVALYPVFCAAIRAPTRGVFRILNLRAVRVVGTLSYSLYLLHYVAIEFVRAHMPLPYFLSGPAAMLLALGASLLMWQFVEKPCAALRKRIGGASAWTVDARSRIESRARF